MWVLLALLFLVVPIVELFLAINVAGVIGSGYTILTLILISVVGAWLVRREGLGLLRRVQTQLEAGKVPTNELVDGLLVLVAATLMLTPGYLTDGLGLALLIPPTRIPIRMLLIRRFRNQVTTRVNVGGLGGMGGFSGFGPFGPQPGSGQGSGRGRNGDVIDVDVADDDNPDAPGDHPELG